MVQVHFGMDFYLKQIEKTTVTMEIVVEKKL